MVDHIRSGSLTGWYDVVVARSKKARRCSSQPKYILHNSESFIKIIFEIEVLAETRATARSQVNIFIDIAANHEMFFPSKAIKLKCNLFMLPRKVVI